ncbi:MAG: hypothetical protein KJO07_10060, partial [Deltaproteobacteria bacterium]|nr:hypothetical protein [Deltaproteobacteria bacterium]
VVTANGGGGGQGSDVGGPGPQNGFDALRSVERAPGGDTPSEGGTGGTGGALADPNGETPRNDPDGTGGGGGGGGYVIDYRGTAVVDNLAVVSPAMQDGTPILQ